MSQTRVPVASQLAEFVDRDRLVERLASLVRAESENPPGHELEAARLVHTYCEDLGLEVTEYECQADRPNVVARWSSGDGPVVGYCSHVDVVPAGDPTLWDHDPYAADIADGRLRGRGSADAKGPVSAALEAVAILRAAGVELAGTLELALVADEETMGFKGAGYLVEQGIISPDIAIVGEPTSLRVVRAQRGATWLRVVTRGVASHGSAPERGRNAIAHMAEIVLRLEETMPDLAHDVLGGPSISVGTIQGGHKINVVPASCVVEIDRRTVPGETEQSVLRGIEAAIELARDRFADIDATIEPIFSAEPFEIAADSRVVTEVVEAVSDALGRGAETIGFRGASDARFLYEAGAEVVVCGPGDIAVAHTAHESIDLDELERAAIAYALAFARLLAPSNTL